MNVNEIIQIRDWVHRVIPSYQTRLIRVGTHRFHLFVKCGIDVWLLRNRRDWLKFEAHLKRGGAFA